MAFWNKTPKGNTKGLRPAKDETRVPLCMIGIYDTSGSMSMDTHYIDENGGDVYKPKIQQLNEGLKRQIVSYRRFMKENTKFCIKHQVIELNSYCQPLFPTFKSINDSEFSVDEISFTADGVTNIEAVFNTTVKFITKEHLGGYNRAVNVIMMSDGVPTDVNGYALGEAAWKRIVDKFKAYLADHDLARNVDLYFIAVGDEAEAFGRYFAGDEHFFSVDDSESIADKLDFVTRLTLANSTTIPGVLDTDDDDLDEDEESDDDDFEEDEDDEEDSDEDIDDEDLDNALDDENEDDDSEDDDDEEIEDESDDLEDILKF